MSEEFDFVGYIVFYDRMYENGLRFTRDLFKPNNGKTVPITFSTSAPPVSSTIRPYQCLGHAVLEDRDDGMVAKCKFNKGYFPNFLTRSLKNHHSYALTFESHLMEVLGNMTVEGTISSVLIVPDWNLLKCVED
jgi:hypothetical protein